MTSESENQNPFDTADPVPERMTARSGLWAGGWRRWAFPGLWLVYLAQTAGGVHEHSTGAAAITGYVIIGVFAGCYLAAIASGWQARMRRFWWLYSATLVLTGVETIFAHADAFVFFVYIAVLTVAAMRQWAVPAIAAMALLTLLAPQLVPGWGHGLDYSGALAIALVGLAMYGFFTVIKSNVQLADARAEVARLAAENERSRIARDLHDLLGHSLTTITVKAGLARRLGERGENARALTEISEVEQLSRRTLGDVRAAVAGHREVTLAGEVATSREVLRAAGINAELPGAVDIVAPELSELFGWVVREGITNVVRHSRGTRVRIKLTRRSVEIADDGRGGAAGAGNGLTGLRERVFAYGGTLTASAGPAGFRLCVEVPVDSVLSSAAPAGPRA
ncbi:MAG: histidine kinase [Jatrophihabitantaceae bacterium]